MPGFNQYTPGGYMPPATQYYSPYPNYQGRAPAMGYSQQLQTPQTNLLRVSGPESAKSYPMGPNSSLALFDAEHPTFYWVYTDDSGFKTMETFDFKKREPEAQAPAQEPIDLSMFATKEDLNSIKSDISDLTTMVKGLI